MFALSPRVLCRKCRKCARLALAMASVLPTVRRIFASSKRRHRSSGFQVRRGNQLPVCVCVCVCVATERRVNRLVHRPDFNTDFSSIYLDIFNVIARQLKSRSEITFREITRVRLLIPRNEPWNQLSSEGSHFQRILSLTYTYAITSTHTTYRVVLSDGYGIGPSNCHAS